MATRIRTSKQTLTLLAALAEKPSEWHYGYALSRETELMSGTLYPILMRLEERGWLETQWETPEPTAEKRGGHPPRHMYRLTASGRAAAVEALTALQNAEQLANKRSVRAAKIPAPANRGRLQVILGQLRPEQG
jgi:PadR family transcriptional regulator PadR